MSYVVLGLGRTGLSLVRFLKKKALPVVVADTRLKPPNLTLFQQRFPDVALHVGAFPTDIMLNAQAIVVPPGLSLADPIFEQCRQKAIPIVGDIELFAQYTHAPTIGITGANGKSTVTSLVGAMAKASGEKTLVGGNIGVPALDLLESDEKPDWFVLELSSFQLDTTYSLELDVAAFLNITRDHLDRHGSLQAYVEAKQKIFHGAQYAVYNRHDRFTHPNHTVKKTLTFGLDKPEKEDLGIHHHEGALWMMKGSAPLMPVCDLQLFGKHNLLNALSALAIGYAAGFEQKAMLDVLKSFKDLKHRCERVRVHEGVVWINDSKGTNVGATQAALESVGESIQGKIVLIAGGRAKDKDFSELLEPTARFVKHVVLFGEDGPLLQTALSKGASTTVVKTLDQAVEQAYALANAQDAVLLSPACTSLDAYSNFEERGDAFIQAVMTL